MKYIIWLLTVLFTVFRKVFGLFWYWVVVWFRAYSRRVVYSYSLENGLFIKRLYERPIIETDDGWTIEPYHGAKGGYVKKRWTCWLEYQFAFWVIWGWVDDDSNYDTFSKGHNDTIISGERQAWLPRFIIDSLKKDNNRTAVYGNTFDLGDARGDNAEFGFWSAMLWNVRNTAYNFAYKFDQTNDENKVWNVKFLGMEFGWKEDNMLDGKMTYKLIAGKNF